MDEEQIEGCVNGYLKAKGFSLKDERSNTDSSLQPETLTRTQLERGSARYHDGYGRLRSWAYRSLDLYKHELQRVLYPVFVHCFMDLVAKGHLLEARNFFHTFREDHEMKHLQDLQKLEAVLSPTHLEEMEFAHSHRLNKFNVKICRYSYELLLQHLQNMQSITIFAIIKDHINFQVTPGQPSSISDDPDTVTLTGIIQDATNQKETLWGLLEESVEDCVDKAGALVSDTEKGKGEAKEGENDESKRRSIDGGKQGGSIKKAKKDKAGSATGKNAKPEASALSATPRIKSELPVPTLSAEVELSILEDLRNRVQLNSVALPSVNFYTFANTDNCLTCSSISHDGTLVAGGFSDSSLKVWDMPKLEHQAATSFSLGGNDAPQNEQILGPNSGKRQYTLFQGHSGPVHAASFSSAGDFILSSSADKTIRLWSTKLNSNLVCYKGHNYPVWDVQFSPAGHYFASCSHDRTARIWSLESIQPLRIMAGHLSDVDCVQWHPNCNYIATGSSDKTVRLWDLQSGECVRVFVGHRSMILSLAISPDGRYMASGDEEGAIMMWDISSGSCVTPLIGHSSSVWTLAFSSEGSLLASGSADCTVKFWDVTTGVKFPRNEEKSGSANRLRSLKSIPTKSASVYSLQFSRRNLLFAAGAVSKRG